MRAHLGCRAVRGVRVTRSRWPERPSRQRTDRKTTTPLIATRRFMTVREALSDVRAIWALFAAAVTAAAFLAGYAQLPAQVHDLREWKVNTAEPVMRFLACSQIAENEGRNAKECEVLLQGLNDILRRPM